MVKVAFVMNSTNVGGAEMMLYKLVSTINMDIFCPVIVIAGDYGPMQQKFETLGIAVYNIPMKDRKERDFRRASSELIKIAEDNKFDILQGWMYEGNKIIQIAAEKLKRKICTVWGIRHSLNNIEFDTWHIIKGVKSGIRLSKKADAILYNSYASKNQHEILGYSSKCSAVIPNGFDCNLFRPDADAYLSVRDELKISRDTRLIGLICRYNPMKDHKNFLKAANYLVQNGYTGHFVLAGRNTGRLNTRLYKMIRALDLQDKVHMLGLRDDIPRVTAALDIAVSSSKTGEGFSNAIGEAMACEIPCVATDVGDAGLILGDTGIVVQPGKPEKLFEGIKQLLNLSEGARRAMGKAARDRIVRYFEIGIIARRFEKFYMELLDKKCRN